MYQDSSPKATKQSIVEGWLARPYTREIRFVATDDGGYWHAFVPQFGYHSLAGIGETPDEALVVLAEAMEVGFEQLARDGEEPPPPIEQLVERPARSGKLTLRLPADLHARLDLEAEQAGLSLNAYLVSRLERVASEEATRRLMREELQGLLTAANVAPRSERRRGVNHARP